MRGTKRTWTDEQLASAVACSHNFSDVLRALGLRPAGGNHATVKRHTTRLGLDTTHFNDEARLRWLRFGHARRGLRPEEVFREASRFIGTVVRRHARLHLLPHRGALCGNEGEWRGQPLTLQLAHANGRYDDNRLENLRWLCPNCHSQTPTFAGRGSVRRVREAPAIYYYARPARRPPAR